MQKPSAPIGVFDSGVGGLSVLRELRQLLPKEDFLFFADQAHVPYGEKNQLELEDLTSRIALFLLERKVKLIVIACNTATCYAIDTLRERFSVPFVGVVPAVKPAVAQSVRKVVAILSTPATAKSPALQKLVDDFASDAQVLRIGCAGLEDAVEAGSIDSPETLRLLALYVSLAMDQEADQIVLGCTHYPFLRDQIQKLAGPHVDIVDSGKAVARRTHYLLDRLNLFRYRQKNGRVTYFTTGDPITFSQVASKLLKCRIRASRVVI